MYSNTAKTFLTLMNKNNRIDEFEINKAFYIKNNAEIIKILPVTNKYPFKWVKILQEISYKCTGQCPYCMNKGLDLNEKEAPVEDYISFYQKIIDAGYQIELRITGGEPLQPNVIERTKQLMHYALNEPQIKKIQLNTNGNWPIPKEWSQYKKLLIQFSLDGDKEYVEKTVKIPNLYEHIIKNFDFCKENNFNFKFRAVISKSNEQYIPYLIQLAKKYNIFISLSYAYPVGGAKLNYKNIEEKVEVIKKTQAIKDNIRSYDYDKIKLYSVIGRCPKMLNNTLFKVNITPNGEFGSCAYLGTYYRNKNFNIYNTSLEDFITFKNECSKDLEGKSCWFPEGFMNFWNSLNKQQKEDLSSFINEKTDTILPTLKEYYDLEEN